MDVKKTSSYIGLIIGAFTLFTIVQAGIVKVVTLIYNEEITEFNNLIINQKYAKDTLVPKILMDLDVLKDWRDAKSQTKAIGMRKNVKTGELWYRAGLDLKLYRAYYNPIKQGYYYDRNGTAYPCH